MAEDNAEQVPDDENDAPPAPPTWNPPASQDELNKIIAARVARVEKRYQDYETLREKAARVDALDNELASETEKAVKAARDEERTAVRNEYSPRLVRTAFRAEAKGVLTTEQLDSLLEDVDLSRFVTADGDVDEERIAKKVAALAPRKSDDEPRFPDLGGGKRGGSPAATNMNDLIRQKALGR